MAYRAHMLRGVSWYATLKVATQLVGYAKIVFLATIFSPEQFGQIGIVFLAVALLELATEGGVHMLIIQHDASFFKKKLHTLFTFSVARGLLIAGLLVAVSSGLQQWLDQPGLAELIRLVAVVPVIQGFIHPGIYAWQRDLKFTRHVGLQFLVHTITAVATVGVAVYTHHIGSFVWGMLLGTSVHVVLSHLLCHERVQLSFLWQEWQVIFSRGSWMTVTGISHYIFHQGDDWIVTKLLGTNALGLYQMAYKFSVVPILNMVDSVAQPLFPIYAHLEHDRARLWRAFLKVSGVVISTSVLVGIGIFLFTDVLLSFLGSEWQAIAPIMQILVVFGVLRSVTATSVSPLFLAVKKQEYVMTYTLVSTVGMLVSIVPLINAYGIWGAGASAIVGSVCAIPVIAYGLYAVFRD